MRTLKSTRLSNKGFTMLEMLTVLLISVTVLAIAFPSYVRWRESVESKTTARSLVYALREARNRTIVNNIQHRIEFEMTVLPAPPGPTGRYRMTQGNRAANSDAWVTVVQDWTAVPTTVSLTFSNLNLNAGNSSIDFNTSGTANIANLATAATVTVQASAGGSRFTVEVTNVGRIRIL